MKTALIAFTGLAGCGKTSLAHGLVKYCGFHRMSFADPIRAMLRELGLTTGQMSIHKLTPIDWLGGKTPRQVMQSLGTEWGRVLVTDDLWVRAVRKRILDAWNIGQSSGVVLDDCRFDNEAAMVQNLGGRVIEVRRPGLVRMAHASENGVSEHLIDGYFNNTGDDLERVLLCASSLI